MIKRDELCAFLDETLDIAGCEDASNNGLQVEGSAEVSRIVFGVDACVALFDQAAAAKADFVIVHHGLSWKDSLKYLTGVNASRVAPLFRKNMSLYAAHLPLDRHHIYGHNKCIAEMLGFQQMAPFFEYHGVTIGFQGLLPEALSLAELTRRVDEYLDTTSRPLDMRRAPIQRVGVVSGGAADAVEDSARLGLDCLVTGEMDHAHYHTAAECAIDVISAGHYRTEVPGLKAVMQLLQETYGVECMFIDIPTGF